MTQKEYNQAIDLWADDIFSFAMYCCNDKERCNDAIQEAFAALWERHEDMAIDRCKGFLLTVTQRKIIDSIRHDRRNVSLDESTIDIQDSTAESGHLLEIQTTSPHEQQDLSNAIHTAMLQLNERQRIILTLHDIEGYTYQEIAKMQHLSHSQVQVTAFRARIKLKKILQNSQTF